MIRVTRRKIDFYFNILFLILLLQIFSVSAVAQNTSIQTSVDKRVIELGEQFIFSIQFDAAEGTSFQYKGLTNTSLPKFEIIEFHSIDTIINKNRSITIKQDLILTAYDTGIHILPAFEIPYYNGGDYDTARSSEISINVTGVDLDLSGDIKDIYPPIATPFNWREIIPYLLYIISLIALIGIGIYAWIYLKKQNTNEETVEIKPVEAAHIDALRQLAILEKENLIQKRQIREFHNRLTEQVRRYIENRFSLNVMEKTSDEILNQVKDNNVDKDSFYALEQILMTGDLVKFAKVKPSDKENEKSLNNAYIFINNTKETTHADNQH